MRFKKCFKEFFFIFFKLLLLSFITINVIQFLRVKENKTLRKVRYSLPLCSQELNSLVGKIKVREPPFVFDALQSTLSSVMQNSNYTNIKGRWKPVNCRARYRVAIIIPYKDRLSNLNYFLYHMHPFLQKQFLEYQIIVVEQSNDDLFNKGVLMNAAFLEIMSMNRINRSEILYNNFTYYNFPFDCVIFHDVDLLPENDKILYSCSNEKPRHLSVAIDKYKYKLLYFKLIGGVLNFRPYHFIQVNGYSNEYWGWGAEDDDMEKRLRAENIGFERPDIKIAHFKMIKHKPRFKNPKRKFYLKHALSRYNQDGLYNLNYRVDYKMERNLFTHFYIDVGQPPQYLIEYLNESESTTKLASNNSVNLINNNKTRKKRNNNKKSQ